MCDKLFTLIHDFIDNETLIIIIALAILAYISPEQRELIAGGFVGYMSNELKKKKMDNGI